MMDDDWSEPAVDRSVRVATSLRMLRVLEVLAAAAMPITATAINAQLGWPKQTVHRLCKRMLEEGYLERDGDSRRLLPAPRARRLGLGLGQARPHQIARHQLLRKVAETVQETVNFVIPEPPGMIYLDRVETNWAFRVQLPIGSHVPFYCTASGKTYMASLELKQRQHFVKSLSMMALTPNTHTTAETLLAELEQAAEAGYALDREEFVEGMVALAVPVRDEAGRYLASLAFHGPAQRLSIDRALGHYPLLASVADQLGQLMTARRD